MSLTKWIAAPLLAACLCPCAAAQTDPVALAVQGLEKWRDSRADLYKNDFGQLSRYRDENARLKAPAPGEKRVVFLGDSITDRWRISEYFPGKPFVNRGIDGQTTPQMLLRFRRDVIELKPATVVVLAGTNDIAGNTGPMTLEEIEGNYAEMAELARLHGIRVVFGSVTPDFDGPFSALRPPEKILALNRWLKDYCAANGHVYLDYYTAMADEKGRLRRELSQDGLHPNAAGYKIMASLAAAALGGS
jgi:lysophospholipase L1-like esterase